MRRLLLVASFGLLLACNSGKQAPASASSPGAGGSQGATPSGAQAASAPSPATQAAAGVLHLGEPITETKLVSLTDITKSPKDFEGKVVATSGTVFAVCQSMGCWMEIKDDANTEAHVRLAGHKFFVPKTSAGHHARVQAKVMRTNPDEECAQEAEQQTGKPVAKLELEATGVDLD
jgi:hypothetical protein